IRVLGQLLDDDCVALAAPVRIELLSGVSQKKHGMRLKRLLDAVPTFRTTNVTWDTAEQWAMAGASRGQRFGAADLIIAAIAFENHGELWALDGDFDRMARLGFIQLFSA